MQKSVIIVDDFYDDPMDVRARALELEYPENTEGYYAGRNSLLMLMNDNILKAVSDLVDSEVVPSPGSANGNFRITLATDKPRQDVHIDPNRDWAGILYLTHPDYCQGGTSFFRHKRLGIDRMPSDPEEIKRLGFDSYIDMQLKIAEGDGMDREKWELTMTAPMRFNRLVLFRSWFWHSFTENFGDSVENGRLIQIFFFDFASRYPEIANPPAKPAFQPTVAPFNFPPRG